MRRCDSWKDCIFYRRHCFQFARRRCYQSSGGGNSSYSSSSNPLFVRPSFLPQQVGRKRRRRSVHKRPATTQDRVDMYKKDKTDLILDNIFEGVIKRAELLRKSKANALHVKHI
jgi:hypothetical protein